MPVKHKNATLNKIKMKNKTFSPPQERRKSTKMSNELKLRVKPKIALKQGLYTIVKSIQVRKS